MSHFDERAKQWDSPDKVARAAVFGDAIKRRVHFKGKIRVLDFGCGTGLLCFQFRDQASAILGVDESEGMLEVFREKEVPGAEAIRFDFEAGELEGKGAFDLVVSSLAFHHLRDPALVLRRLVKLLAPGGRIAVIDLDEEDGSFHPDPAASGVYHSGFSAGAVSAWARDVGLRLESREIISELAKNGRTYPVFLAVLTAATDSFL
ncbi:MAG: class I SAM-dependent DNA methyltransferase [Bdellovibrionota bacterium]